MEYKYLATIHNVVDGDTVDATVDLGFKIYFDMRLRLNGIDAPELNSSDVVVREAAKVTKARLVELVLDKTILLETFKVDKYGRYLADLYVDGKKVNDMLIEEGMAVPYFGGKR